MVGFGLVLAVPKLSAGFSRLMAETAGQADKRLDQINHKTIAGQFVGGLLLGMVWSPCIGPTLGGAIALASQGENLLWASLIMTGFALGVVTVVLATGYGARSLLLRYRARIHLFSRLAQPVTGAVFIFVGTALYFDLHHPAEAWLLNALPDWLIILSVSL